MNFLPENDDENLAFYLHGAEPPSLYVVTGTKRHPHDLVAGNAKELFLLLAVESHHKEGHPIVWEGLPGLDEVHLGF